jgi:hypothetical protein
MIKKNLVYSAFALIGGLALCTSTAFSMEPEKTTDKKKTIIRKFRLDSVQHPDGCWKHLPPNFTLSIQGNSEPYVSARLYQLMNQLSQCIEPQKGSSQKE